ncbi:MAG: hypothetical protein OIN66_09145 [Candidatus Methanoperedens sp.]|nr:hypothetical protein [Candidatus Methanoperedens sp.]
MGSGSGDVLAELKNISKEEAFAVGIGGLLIGSTVTHGEMVSALSAVVMRAVETMLTIYRDNIAFYSDTGKLIIAGAPGTTIIYQKNQVSAGMRKERSRWEIIEDMLSVLIEEKRIKKTRLMQRACLNWRDLQRYFDFLVEENFIAECANPGGYELTERGRELLKRLRNVDEILRQD